MTFPKLSWAATNQAGEDNRNIARMAVILSGLPVEVTGVTVNRLCGSGMEALVGAVRAIALGDHEVVIAGGVESMSRAPYAMQKADEAFARKPPQIFDTSLGWRFQNPKMTDFIPLDSMGMTAENVADKYDISRADQDAFALASHQKAAAAWENKRFEDEIIDIEVPPASKKSKAVRLHKDESLRPDSSLEALSKLRAVFKEGGSVTAGNSSPLNDGAAVVALASADWAEKNNVKPIARFLASGVAGVHPSFMGVGPIPAVRQAFSRITDVDIGALDIVELNEAFAAQSLACIRELGLDEAKVNPNGGAIALGHPIGCSGARIVCTLLHQMKDDASLKLGLASLCIGVGQGLATVVERV